MKRVEAVRGVAWSGPCVLVASNSRLEIVSDADVFSADSPARLDEYATERG